MQPQIVELILQTVSVMRWALVCLTALFLFRKELRKVLKSIDTFRVGSKSVEFKCRTPGNQTGLLRTRPVKRPRQAPITRR